MKKGAVAVLIVVVALVIAAAGVYWKQQSVSSHGSSMQAAAQTPNGHQGDQHSDGQKNGAAPPSSTPKNNTQTVENKPSKSRPTAAHKFCSRDFSDVAARKADVPRLAKAGGLVDIFQHEAALKDPYGCAAFYLKQGLDIDATDPRPDSQHLTGLHFAIKRNDPRMVQFMLDHGANLHKRAGPNHIKPYGYAVFLALQNQSTDYNQVIGMLDKALDDGKADAGQ